MVQIAVIILYFIAGFALKHFGVFNQRTARSFNWLVIYISLPSIVLLKIHDLSFQTGLFIPVSMAWLNFGLSFIFFVVLGRFCKWKRATTGALVMMGGLGNTSFVGFPMVEAFYGRENLPTAILADQLGSFLVLALTGVPVAVYFGGGQRRSLTSLLAKVLKFPPFLALILAIILMRVPYPSWLTSLLGVVGLSLLPLALMSVGVQTKFAGAEFSKAKLPLAAGLGFKLVIVPALLAAFYFLVVGSHEVSTKVTVFLSAMAPMITAGIVSVENGLDGEIVNLMLGVGIPLSLLTSTLWFYLIN